MLVAIDERPEYLHGVFVLLVGLVAIAAGSLLALPDCVLDACSRMSLLQAGAKILHRLGRIVGVAFHLNLLLAGDLERTLNGFECLALGFQRSCGLAGLGEEAVLLEGSVAA